MKYTGNKRACFQKNIKLSHLVAEALSEKTRKMKEESFVERINQGCGDPEVAQESHRMAETIADNMDLEELP
jgi:hypothetical protein